LKRRPPDFTQSEINSEIEHIKANPLVKFSSSTVFRTRYAPTHNKTGFRGVKKVRVGSLSRWRAALAVGKKKKIYSKCYKTPEEAAQAYDDMARKEWGSAAVLNFPGDPSA